MKEKLTRYNIQINGTPEQLKEFVKLSGIPTHDPEKYDHWITHPFMRILDYKECWAGRGSEEVGVKLFDLNLKEDVEEALKLFGVTITNPITDQSDVLNYFLNKL